MPELHETNGWSLAILGLALLAGYLAHVMGRKVRVPRVTLLVLLGVLCGPVLGLVPEEVEGWFPFVAHLALAMVGFLLGERFLGRDLRRSSRLVLGISIAETLLAAAMVFLVLLLAGASVPFALVLAGIAPATAPAATYDIATEGRAKGPLTDVLLRVVAIDDVWGILLFSLLLVVAEAAAGQADSAPLLQAALDVGGSIALGLALGLPMAALTGRLRPGEPTLVEAAGFVLLCAGLAAALGLSYLLACVTLGAVVANRARHHTRPFHAIEGVTEPCLALFFVLSGIRLEPAALVDLGLLGVLYVLARSIGLVLGGYLGARSVGAPEVIRRHIGWCLLPQAGIALGLALLVLERIPELGAPLLSLVIASTVLFEIGGPIVTRKRLTMAGEIRDT